MAACVLGPRYLLSRKAREVLPTSAFAAAGAALPFRYIDDDGVTQTIPGTYTPDNASVALYGDKLEALLGTFIAATAQFSIPDISEPDVIKIAFNEVKGTTLNTYFRGRDAAIGDIIYTTGTDGGAVTRRKIKGFRGVTTAASVGTPAGSVYNPATTAAALTAVSMPSGGSAAASGTAFNGLAVGSKVDNLYGEEYTVTVRLGGAQGVATVDVATTSGHFSATAVTTSGATTSFIIGNTAVFGGRTITLTSPDSALLTQGHVYKFKLKGAYAPLTMDTHLVIAGTYTGTKTTTYLIEVTGTNSSSADFDDATVRITDTAGIDDVIEETVIVDGTAHPLGALGLTFEFDGAMPTQNGLRVGDIYYVVATTATDHATNFDKIVLDGPAVDTALFPTAGTLFSVSHRLGFTGKILATDSSDEEAWTNSATALTYESGLALYLSTRSAGYTWCAFVDAIGTLEVSFRALVPTTTSETMQSVNSVDDITEKAGPIDLDNDLSYAVYQAFTASGGKTTYFVSTGADTLAAFIAALKKISSTRVTYALAMVSSLTTVRDQFKTHVEAQSAPTMRNFRKFYFGVDSPGRYRVGPTSIMKRALCRSALHTLHRSPAW